jgi:hypothetical protein
MYSEIPGLFGVHEEQLHSKRFRVFSRFAQHRDEILSHGFMGISGLLRVFSPPKNSEFSEWMAELKFQNGLREKLGVTANFGRAPYMVPV